MGFILIFSYFQGKIKYKEKLTIDKSQISFKLNDLSSYKSYYITSFYDFIKKSNYLYRLNQDNKIIEIYDLNKKKFKKNIGLDFKCSGFCIDNTNNIYALIDEKNIILNIDSLGKITKVYNLNKLLNKNKTIQRVIYSYTEQPLLFYSSLLIFNVVVNVPPPKFYKYETIGIFNTENKELILTAKFPKTMDDGKDRFGYYPNFTIVDNMLICSFATDHRLYFYNLEGKLISSKECKSKYISKFPITDLTKFNDRAYNAKFQNEMPMYYNLIYDKYRELIYRICLHKQNNINQETGFVNDFIDREWSLMILNKEFKILKEIKFPPRIFNFQEICVTKDGLLISLNNENNPEFNPNILSYKLLKIRYE